MTTDSSSLPVSVFVPVPALHESTLWPATGIRRRRLRGRSLLGAGWAADPVWRSSRSVWTPTVTGTRGRLHCRLSGSQHGRPPQSARCSSLLRLARPCDRDEVVVGGVHRIVPALRGCDSPRVRHYPYERPSKKPEIPGGASAPVPIGISA